MLFPLTYCLNLSLIWRYSVLKTCFLYVIKFFSYLFHENETFATLRSVDFQLFRDLVWFVALCR